MQVYDDVVVRKSSFECASVFLDWKANKLSITELYEVHSKKLCLELP